MPEDHLRLALGRMTVAAIDERVLEVLVVEDGDPVPVRLDCRSEHLAIAAMLPALEAGDREVEGELVVALRGLRRDLDERLTAEEGHDDVAGDSNT